MRLKVPKDGAAGVVVFLGCQLVFLWRERARQAEAWALVCIQKAIRLEVACSQRLAEEGVA
jgi:hypothetical protein